MSIMWDHIPKQEALRMAGVWASEESRRRAAKAPTVSKSTSAMPVPILAPELVTTLKHYIGDFTLEASFPGVWKVSDSKRIAGGTTGTIGPLFDLASTSAIEAQQGIWEAVVNVHLKGSRSCTVRMRGWAEQYPDYGHSGRWVSLGDMVLFPSGDMVLFPRTPSGASFAGENA